MTPLNVHFPEVERLDVQTSEMPAKCTLSAIVKNNVYVSTKILTLNPLSPGGNPYIGHTGMCGL